MRVCVTKRLKVKSINCGIWKRWELTPLKGEVHEEFRESISFDRSRYSVKSPWKEGCSELPTNYSTSLRRLKFQVARLEKEPEVLREYASIINHQLDSGVIEKVVELKRG